MPRERRLALLSTLILLALLGGILFYQQQMMDAPPPSPLGEAGQGRLVNQAPPPDETAEAPEAAAPVAEAKPEPPVRPTHLALPLAGEPLIVKPYASLDEIYGDFRYYTAMAYEAEPGQRVLAAAKGQVVAIERDPIEGTVLVLDHGGGMTTRYAGLSKVLVAKGAEVAAGAVIGEAGEAVPARAELGPHLAFSVWLDGEPTDPTELLED